MSTTLHLTILIIHTKINQTQHMCRIRYLELLRISQDHSTRGKKIQTINSLWNQKRETKHKQ